MKNLILIGFLLTGITISSQSVTGDLLFRNIGPANQGGRIVDIEADRNDFTRVVAATGSGGVWLSENAGTTWQPIFEKYNTASIGDVALDPKNKNVIWVGTGEPNNRNSVSWGNGIYKSTDNGVTFQNMGLESTQQIARISVNPEDPDDVCVCAIGALWGYSGERGLFQTKDGGKNWIKKDNGLPNDGKTGCTDLVRDPNKPKVLYAAFYHRIRKPWTFHSGGGEGGIYKSENNGKSWKKLSDGLPDETGRIGLAIYEKDPKVLMAFIESKKSDTLAVLGSGVYKSENAGKTWTYVNTYNNRPFYYSQIRINPHDHNRVYLLTTSFMVSNDGGTTFNNGSADYEVHGDFHAMWLDPKDPDRYYLGADKGLSLTHDHGKSFRLMDNLPIGQFYRINFDYQDPYYVYGGLQDNGSYAVASFSRDARGILNDNNWKMHWGDGMDAASNPFNYQESYSSAENSAFYAYNPLTRDIHSITPNLESIINISDFYELPLSDYRSTIRYNWSAPLVMSSHNPNTLYIGSNHVFKSTDKGQSWKIISPDLTTNDPIKKKFGGSGGITPDNTGAEAYCAIFSLSISPISEDLIWVGTDDGQVQVSRDGGKTWSNVGNNILGMPSDLWVSRIEASHSEPGTAYVSFDGHRSDNFGTYLFKTKDYGKTWLKITNGIENGEVIRVVREDPTTGNLLFIGTETGIWMSLDAGENWKRMKAGLPTVSVYDLKIHPRENDLIVGTHGRSIYIMDDISPLQKLASEQSDKMFQLFKQKEATIWKNKSRGGQRGHFWFAGENPGHIKNTSSIPRANFLSTVPISFSVENEGVDSLDLEISDPVSGHTVKMKIEVHAGINRYYWDRQFSVEPLTAKQDNEIKKVLESGRSWSNGLNRIYARYARTESLTDKRKLIHSMVQEGSGSYLPEFLPQDYGIPTASEGVYKIKLCHLNQCQTSFISIRKDPLIDGK